MSFATNLRFLRQKKGWSQDKLAEHLGYKSFTTIQKWESNKAEPNIRILRKLSDLFDVNMTDFLNKDLKSEDKQIESENMIEFTNAAEAMKFILKTPTMIDFCGYDISDLTDSDQDVIVNQVNTYLSFIMSDYINKK